MNEEQDLTLLLCCESQNRKEFEDFIKGLKAVKYSLNRDEHKEYTQAAVFHMWTGFCIATKLNTPTKEVDYE